ncbi:MAG: hypothetical protein PVG07_06785 [Acidobacteriota bacterium]
MHRLNPETKCLTSTVRVCAQRRQGAVYEGRHVIYGVCEEDGGDGGETPEPGEPPGPPGGQCCGLPVLAAAGCCPEPEPETCTFEVRLAESDVVRQDAFDGKAELQVTGYANGETATHPSGSSWFIHHRKWGWLPINKLITRVEVEKGTERIVDVMAEGIEADIAGGGSPEHGASVAGRLVLACDRSVEPATVRIDFHRLKTGAGDIIPSTLEVDVRFRAYQVTP